MKPLSGKVAVILILIFAGIHGLAAEPAAGREAEIRTTLEEMRDEYDALNLQIEARTGEDRRILEEQAFRMILGYLDEIHELVGILAKKDADDEGARELRAFLLPIVAKAPVVLEREIAVHQAAIDRLREQFADAGAAELSIIEERIAQVQADIDGLYAELVRRITALQSIGEDVASEHSELADKLKYRALLSSGRLRITVREKNLFKELANSNPENTELKQQLAAIHIRIENAIAEMDRQISMMAELGLDVTRYQTLMVETTGDITRGLGVGVVSSLAEKWWTALRDWFADDFPGFVGKILMFALIVLGFRFLGRTVRAAVVRAMDSPKVKLSRLLKTMVANLSGNAVLAVGILIALSQVGVSLGPVLAGVGVAGFIIGFALQETLGNFAAGLMILFYRPYDVGDFIEAGGVSGVVHNMSLVSTTILTFDNQTLIVPNNKVWGDVIRNVTHQTKRRVDLTIGVSYSSDIPQVERVLQGILDDYDKVLKDPEPLIRVIELGDSSVNFAFRPWVKTDDYWEAYWHLTREVKIRFDKEGIGIPFPQRDVHHYYPEDSKPPRHSTGETDSGPKQSGQRAETDTGNASDS